MIHLICPNPAIDRTLLVKGFQPEIPNRPYEVREYAGGKSFNVAYAISFENTNVDFVVHTILGGRNGAAVREIAEANGTPVRPVMIDVNTRLCNIIMDTESATTYPIYENSFVLETQLLDRFTNSLTDAIAPGDTIVFSGSLMKGMPSDYIASFIRQFRSQNVKIFVDTSGPALSASYQEKPYAIKINDEEIAELFPDKKLETMNDYLHLLKSPLTKDIPIFIVTLGAKGIIGKVHDEYYAISAKKVDAKNPIASGDFFLGGLVKQDTLGVSPKEMLSKAITYSTANVLNWFPELKEEDLESIATNLTIKKFH
ncbi:1-phosphofructokinase family hexose kinase [Enterococcus faecium]|uniref:1-phosphofructokinase family hexose kinase n=1 Tax=Enterococcus faecium TaxID=1352 RepID=UPI0002A41834|nr:PfkB family carbohydrate kinase [Enterococcus faecium]ELB05483.1 1-phosphofructokinase family hexose kinase [Enterococcus faecium EnGen0028]MDT6323806.1 PfkB family carbohydrate kinase [Enterococcus faecium]